MTSAGTKTAVEVERLGHAYDGRMALRDLALEVKQGEVFGILGPNGGGKTTLFRILATLIVPASGTARVFGVDVLREPHEARRRIGVVFQSPSLDRNLTVAENLRHQGHLFGLRGARLRARIAEVLGRFGLADRRNERARNLSGGLARRSDLARGLLHRPDLLLLDEPTAGLDPGARSDLWAYVRELRARDGVTVLFTTHLLEEAEGCDRLAILDRGSLVALGVPDELKAEVGGDVVTVEGRNPERLRDRIAASFGGEPALLDGKVRIERERGHEFARALVEALGAEITAVSVRRPSLEDVFIRRTRRRFEVDA